MLIEKQSKKFTKDWLCYGHLDRQFGKSESEKKQAEEKFKEITNAFEKLSGKDNNISSNFEDFFNDFLRENGFGGISNLENWCLGIKKRGAIRNLKPFIELLEDEVNADPNFWNDFGRDWEERIENMDDYDQISELETKMNNALMAILDQKRQRQDDNIDDIERKHS
jgi:DnaJ-class molecular chaperone